MQIINGDAFVNGFAATLEFDIDGLADVGIEQCRKRLEEYAVPWEIEFLEELPKSFVGKVLRRMLVED